jgi:hypothetical protein
MVSVVEPRPLLNEGVYLPECTDTTCARSRRWKNWWIVSLVVEPPDYDEPTICGRLCRFLSLGTNPKRAHAGQFCAGRAEQSQFRRLWVEGRLAQTVGIQRRSTRRVAARSFLPQTRIFSKADFSRQEIPQCSDAQRECPCPTIHASDTDTGDRLKRPKQHGTTKAATRTVPRRRVSR